MRKILLLVLWGASANTSAAPNVTFPNDQGIYGVGLRLVQQYDRARVYKDKTDLMSGTLDKGERARPMQTLIWYPTKKMAGISLRYNDYLRSASTEVQFERSVAEVDRDVAAALQDNYSTLSVEQARGETARVMSAVRDAQAAQGKFPIVIYAPGSSSSAHENADLCEYLASHGYIVLASASIGVNTRSMSVDLEGAEAQAGDISFLVGYAATLAQADSSQVAVVGYSFGGLANVLAAARDDRIGALVALDGSVRYYPAIVQAAAYATPERLALPMLYLGGKPSTAEVMNRNKQVPTYSLMNQMKYSDLYNVTMYTMEHAAFQSESLRLGPEQRFGEYSRDEAALAYGWMGRYVLAFLDAYLKNDALALKFMNNEPKANGAPAHLLSLDVHRAEGAAPTMSTLASKFAQRNYKNLTDVYSEMSKRDVAFKPGERALISWGEPFMEQKRYHQAIEIFTLASTLYPESGRAAFYLALAYDKNEDNALSIEAYQRVLGFWPGMPEAKQSIERLQAAAIKRTNK
jgi:dienelactone hydrolase